MLAAFGLVAAGFLLGVVLTALVASTIFGHVYEEMARYAESYGGVLLFTSEDCAARGGPSFRGQKT